METRIVVCGIVCKDNAVLLGKKAKGQPPYPDVWHTLGGGINDQEKGMLLLNERKFDDAYFHEELRRELREEASIDVDNIRFLQPRKDVANNKHGEPTQFVFLEYFCDHSEGIPTPGDDIAHVQWFDKNELKTVELTPPSKEMYAELGWL